jgi:MFS superfamily sulfate permease-like transporter
MSFHDFDGARDFEDADTFQRRARAGSADVGGGETENFVDISKHPDAKPVPGWLILAVFGKIHFANCGRLKEIFDSIHQLENQDGRCAQVICLDLRGVPSFDSSSVEVT